MESSCIFSSPSRRPAGPSYQISTYNVNIMPKVLLVDSWVDKGTHKLPAMIPCIPASYHQSPGGKSLTFLSPSLQDPGSLLPKWSPVGFWSMQRQVFWFFFFSNLRKFQGQFGPSGPFFPGWKGLRIAAGQMREVHNKGVLGVGLQDF